MAGSLNGNFLNITASTVDTGKFDIKSMIFTFIGSITPSAASQLLFSFTGTTSTAAAIIGQNSTGFQTLTINIASTSSLALTDTVSPSNLEYNTFRIV
jgi:hypothetical protein